MANMASGASSICRARERIRQHRPRTLLSRARVEPAARLVPPLILLFSSRFFSLLSIVSQRSRTRRVSSRNCFSLERKHVSVSLFDFFSLKRDISVCILSLSPLYLLSFF